MGQSFETPVHNVYPYHYQAVPGWKYCGGADATRALGSFFFFCSGRQWHYHWRVRRHESIILICSSYYISGVRDQDASYAPDGRFPCRPSVSAVSLASGSDFDTDRDSCFSGVSLTDEHTALGTGQAAHPHLKFFVVPEVHVLAVASRVLLRRLYPDVLLDLTCGNLVSSHRFASFHDGFSYHTALPPLFQSWPSAEPQI